MPQAALTYTQEVKKSRFIVDIAHTQGVEAAKAFIQQRKAIYSDARHHCWAYVAAAPNNSMDIGFSDDGEPSGTAGKPILAQLQGSGIGEICAVVTRYFGGTKLGTGGLVKAYGGGVQQALFQLSTQLKQLTAELTLSFSYADQNAVQMVLEAAAAERLFQKFDERISLQVAVPRSAIDSVKAQLLDKTQGRIAILGQPAEVGHKR